MSRHYEDGPLASLRSGVFRLFSTAPRNGGRRGDSSVTDGSSEDDQSVTGKSARRASPGRSRSSTDLKFVSSRSALLLLFCLGPCSLAVLGLEYLLTSTVHEENANVAQDLALQKYRQSAAYTDRDSHGLAIIDALSGNGKFNQTGNLGESGISGFGAQVRHGDAHPEALKFLQDLEAKLAAELKSASEEEDADEEASAEEADGMRLWKAQEDNPERLTPPMSAADGPQLFKFNPQGELLPLAFPPSSVPSSEANKAKLKASEDLDFEMIWSYGEEQKHLKYTGNKYWADQFSSSSRQYYNSKATFAFTTNNLQEAQRLENQLYDAQGNVLGAVTRMHGLLGVYPNGTQLWKPQEMPLPIDQVNRTEAMRRGGFYLDLVNALPMDRMPDDTRDSVCTRETWNYADLDNDASVVITFYNEPLATLLRTVHSVLNLTPPPLLKEVILVDDHSNLPENLPGSELYEYIKLLPKTKILRLGERRGLVWARLAGAQAATGKTLVVLDSHVEVNVGWLEPQLQRIKEEPRAIVFPQIMALDADTMTYNKDAGIGCFLSWKWSMVEQASLTGAISDTSPIPSPSMAGGLFAADLRWFWELGGYDEEFSMWGSENVEMGFRTWMCGGRLECTPCARTYHIYRSGGSGYKSPGRNVWINKARTSRLWMGPWAQISDKFINREKDVTNIGDVSQILALKKRLQCKSFGWFLANVDPGHEGQELEHIELLGELRNAKYNNMCIDSLSNFEAGQLYGAYYCHGKGGTQAYLKDKNHKHIRSVANESNCLSYNGTHAVFQSCTDPVSSDNWTFTDIASEALVGDGGSSDEGRLGRLEWTAKADNSLSCLTLTHAPGSDWQLQFISCADPVDSAQLWKAQPFKLDPNFASEKSEL